ncbi:MAG: hypothetical protein ACD_60C00094G0001 [uncultured bacterium]|nr:MAG: hypothetical protein ACD_60C00094G0001 [uncultured bacterium]
MNTALIVAGIVFGLVALVHILRLVLKFDVIIAGKPIPMWGSVVGLVISLILMLWMFSASTG